MRFTLFVAVAMHGTKLPIFVIFKGKTNGNVEKNFHGIIPAGAFGYTRSKACCDERVMHKWYYATRLPFIAGHAGEFGLLLDDYKVRKTESVHYRMISECTNLFLIHAHYTSVLQPCDVGISKIFKERLKKVASNWRRDRNALLNSRSRLSPPKRHKILEMRKTI